MTKLLIITLFFNMGLCSIVWNTEIVDSLSGVTNDYYFNSLALDAAGNPYIIFNRNNKIIYAFRDSLNWRKETIDSGFYYYGFSMAMDTNNTPLLCYYRRNESGDTTQLYYAYCTNNIWYKTVIDSIFGYLGNWWDYIVSSMVIDSYGNPGIAYVFWDSTNLIHYIKYLHYNGLGWNSTTVEYDSAYVNIQTMPTDWWPSLQYNSNSTPYIAFHHMYGTYDTIKLAHYNDTLNRWIIEPVINRPQSGYPVSLKINRLDYPCLAHGLGADVVYTYRDSISWHTEYTGISMGWDPVWVVLDLDTNDIPSILFRMDFTPVIYCYKEGEIWNTSNWLGSGDWQISLALDRNNDPHVCFGYSRTKIDNQINYNMALKYLRGTVLNIQEKNTDNGNFHNNLIDIYPNPAKNKLYINFSRLIINSDTQIEIYNTVGILIRKYNIYPLKSRFIVWDGKDQKGKVISTGIYFIRVISNNSPISEKVIFIK